MHQAGDRFPETRPSAIRGVASDDPAERARAFDVLVRAYWRPVYKHVRLKWRRDAEDARDATQGFFARAFEKGSFGGYDPDRARFRTYLKGSLDHYAMELSRDASRQKRGGGALPLSLDFEGAEEELTRSGALASADPRAADACFDHEWTRSLFSAAVAALESQCDKQGKQIYFDVFRRYQLDPEMKDSAPAGGAACAQPSYADVAAACGLSVSDVTNYLAWTRRELRACILAELREITSNEEDYLEEARALGVPA